ncbi:hypothetical protein HY251_11440, partial [bacterium]|nr:hypothetical protein [bacterium]
VAAVQEEQGKTATEVVEHVMGAVKEFSGKGSALRDDLTVVAIRRV